MKNIDIYYESIEQVYNEIQEQENRPEPLSQKIGNWMENIALSILLLSLIPIIPFVFVFVLSLLNFSFGPINLNQPTVGSYAIAWILAVFISFIILGLSFTVKDKWLSNKVDNKSKQMLSSEQLTFIMSYKAYKELKVFFINRFNRHVSSALNLLRRLVAPPSFLPFMIDQGMFREPGQSILSQQLLIAQEFLQTFEKYSWIHIDETLCAIMDETTSPLKFSVELKGGEQESRTCQKIVNRTQKSSQSPNVGVSQLSINVRLCWKRSNVSMVN